MAGHIPDATSSDWCTPDDIIEAVRKVFGGNISLDPCWNQWSSVKPEVAYVLPKNDGLEDTWGFPSVFVNPPYGPGFVHCTTRDFKTPKEMKAHLESIADKRERAKEKRAWRRTTVTDWVKKCGHAHREHGSEVIALIPAYVDTKPWQDVIYPSATAVCFLRGRLSFRLPGHKTPQCDFEGLSEGPCERRAVGRCNEDMDPIHLCEEHGGDKHLYDFCSDRAYDATDPAPMACALVYWGKNFDAFAKEFGVYGFVWSPTNSHIDLRAKNALALAALKDFYDTTQESTGIAGWHLNGDIMTWGEYDLTPVRELLADPAGTWSVRYIEALEQVSVLAARRAKFELPPGGVIDLVAWNKARNEAQKKLNEAIAAIGKLREEARQNGRISSLV